MCCVVISWRFKSSDIAWAAARVLRIPGSWGQEQIICGARMYCPSPGHSPVGKFPFPFQPFPKPPRVHKKCENNEIDVFSAFGACLCFGNNLMKNPEFRREHLGASQPALDVLLVMCVLRAE